MNQIGSYMAQLLPIRAKPIEFMGSHFSSFTRSSWKVWLNSGSLKRSWQDLVPFAGLEFHTFFFLKKAVKMVKIF